jgi:hypothetical protein
MYYKLKNVAKARVELLLSCLFFLYAKKFNSALLVAAVAAAAQRNGIAHGHDARAMAKSSMLTLSRLYWRPQGQGLSL